jgi:hypothetical protein
MQAMDPDGITLGFVAAIAIVFVGAVVRRIAGARRAHDWLHLYGAHAQGEVLRVWQEHHGAYCVRYRFTPRGAEAPVTRDEYVGYLIAAVPEVGTKVGVRYDPEAPERSLLARAP